MKFFGEYLVEKGLVNPDDLVKALLEQVNTTPSVAAVTHELGLMGAKEMLLVLGHQSRQQVEFKKAATDLGKWTPEIDATVLKTLSQKKIPIGQILVKNRATSFDILTKALDEFLSQEVTEESQASRVSATVAVPASPPPPSSNLAVPAASSAPAAAAQAAGGSKGFEFATGLNPAMTAELVDFFNPDFQNRLKMSFEFLSSSPTDLVAEVTQKDVHQLLGVAVMAQATLSAKIIQKYEDSFVKAFDQLNQGAQESLQLISQLGPILVELIAVLVQSIQRSQAEKDGSVGDEYNERVSQFFAAIERIG
jgi:hypothetical protein